MNNFTDRIRVSRHVVWKVRHDHVPPNESVPHHGDFELVSLVFSEGRIPLTLSQKSSPFPAARLGDTSKVSQKRHTDVKGP